MPSRFIFASMVLLMAATAPALAQDNTRKTSQNR
jgi:hypothetical protein